MARMRSLVALLAGLGTLGGLVVGVFAHHGASSMHSGGWTFYTQTMPRRYADYLPGVPGHAPWLPGIIVYTALGLGAGLIVAATLLLLGFRLVRPPARPPAGDVVARTNPK